MSDQRFNTGNPIGSNSPLDRSDNTRNLDVAVNSTAPAWTDRLGRNRKSFEGMEREFDSDQAFRDNAFESAQTYRENEFVGAQADKQQRFNLLLANSGYEYLADYAAGIEITEYNQVLRDTAGELWRAAATATLPYTTDGTGLPEGGAFVAVGDADIRNDLAAGVGAGKGGLLVAGAVIYVDTIADLQALPTSGLEDGQAAVVHGSEVRWSASASAWQPIRGVTVEAFGAVGDGVTDDSAAIISAAAFSDHVLFSRKQYVAQGLTIRTGLIYEGVSGEAEIHLPESPTDHMFKTTGIVDTIQSGGLKNLKLYGGGTTVFNGADFSSIYDQSLDFWNVEDCWFIGFNRGFNGSNNDREPTFRSCRFLNNVIGAYGGEHPMFINCDFRSNDIGLSGRLNDFKITHCKFTYNRIGVTPDRANAKSISNAIFDTCGFFKNREAALIIGSTVTVSNCRIVGNGAGSVGIHLFSGYGNIIIGNSFSQVGFDHCIVLNKESTGAIKDLVISSNAFEANCISAIKLYTDGTNLNISGNSFYTTSGTGVFIEAESGWTTSLINNNYFYSSDYFYKSSTRTHNCLFSGNRISYAAADGCIKIGSVGASQANVFTGNFFEKVGTGTAAVFSGSIARSTITGNRFSANAIIGFDLITNSTDARFSGNSGINESATGSFTFATGATDHTISVSMDIPFTLADIQLVPRNSGAAKAEIYIIPTTGIDLAAGTITFTSPDPMPAGAVFGYKIVAGDV